MKRFIILAYVLTILFPGDLRAGKGSILTPSRFTTKSSVQEDSTVLSGLQSNVIVEIRTQGDSLVWLATGDGLSQMRDSLSVRTFPSSDKLTAGETVTKLPSGGITAVAAAGIDTLLVSVVTSIEEETSGGGLALTYNSQDTSNVSWLIFDQPVDSSADSTVSWGGKTLRALPITVSQQNVTYDIAVSNDYFWIASWAGGLRRLLRSAVSSGWQRVPLPADDMSQMLCDDQYQDYKLNPRDPPDGNHNHKAFAVIAYGDTVWVGTANGINRGIIDATGCVDWEHYSFPINGISGNWVVGLARQKTKGRRIIWVATRVADTGGESGISYSEDDGLSWHTIPILRGEWGYNISTRDSLVYISTRNGLWKSNDGVNFALSNRLSMRLITIRLLTTMYMRQFMTNERTTAAACSGSVPETVLPARRNPVPANLSGKFSAAMFRAMLLMPIQIRFLPTSTIFLMATVMYASFTGVRNRKISHLPS